MNLAEFYVECDAVPDGLPTAMDAITHRQLTLLKLDVHSFCFLLLPWTLATVNHKSAGLQNPLPEIARILPLTTSTWNTLTDGGDTLTYDWLTSAKERISVRSEVNIAVFCILLNIGLIFHHCNQMSTSDISVPYTLPLPQYRQPSQHCKKVIENSIQQSD